MLEGEEKMKNNKAKKAYRTLMAEIKILCKARPNGRDYGLGPALMEARTVHEIKITTLRVKAKALIPKKEKK